METYDRMVEMDRGHLPSLVGFATLALATGQRLSDATTCALRAAIRTDNRPDMVSLLAECYHRRQVFVHVLLIEQLHHLVIDM